MRSTEISLIAAMWAAAVAAHPTDIGVRAAASHEWTMVESHCWSDTKYNIRALDHHAVNWDTSCATVEKCLAACEIEGYCLAGLEYGHECWCGNVVHGDVRPVPDSYCNFPCSGDFDDNCGGHGFIGLYIRKGFELVIAPPKNSHKYPHKHDYEPPAGMS